MPSWITGIHQKDHIIGSNVAFLLNPFVSSAQGRQLFLHQSPPTLGYEILCKLPSISEVEREVINDPGCKLSAHLAVKEVVRRQNVFIVGIAATISERTGIQNSFTSTTAVRSSSSVVLDSPRIARKAFLADLIRASKIPP